MEKELVKGAHLNIMLESFIDETSGYSAAVISEKHTALTIKACISELKRIKSMEDIQKRIDELLTFF